MNFDTIQDNLFAACGKSWYEIANACGKTTNNGNNCHKTYVNGNDANQVNCGSHFDSLYPEWDEFYLLVCDMCGIIIRSQALEKHLITHHLTIAQAPATKPATITNSAPTIKQIPVIKQAPIIKKPPTINEAPTPPQIKLALTNPQQTIHQHQQHQHQHQQHQHQHQHQQQSQATTMTQFKVQFYLDRRWRNTFNALKDAFL